MAAIAAAVTAFLSLVGIVFVVWRFVREEQLGRLARVGEALTDYVLTAEHARQGDQEAVRELRARALALQAAIAAAPGDLGKCLRAATNYSRDAQAVATSAEECFIEFAETYHRVDRWPLRPQAGGARWVRVPEA